MFGVAQCSWHVIQRTSMWWHVLYHDCFSSRHILPRLIADDIIDKLEAPGWLEEEDSRAYNPISPCRWFSGSSSLARSHYFGVVMSGPDIDAAHQPTNSPLLGILGVYLYNSAQLSPEGTQCYGRSNASRWLAARWFFMVHVPLTMSLALKMAELPHSVIYL